MGKYGTVTLTGVRHEGVVSDPTGHAAVADAYCEGLLAEGGG